MKVQKESLGLVFPDQSNISHLIDSDEKAVNKVPRGAGVQCLFVLLDLHVDELSQLLNLGKTSVLGAGQMIHEPGKDVVQLWDNNNNNV